MVLSVNALSRGFRSTIGCHPMATVSTLKSLQRGECLNFGSSRRPESISRWLRLVIVAIGVFVSVFMMQHEAGGSGSKMEKDKIEPGSKTIVVIGASYAGGWDPGMPIAGYRMVNKGVPGEETSQVSVRFDTDALALKPDAVIIWGFINDVFRSDRTRIDERLARTRETLLAMVESARKAWVKPILATEVTIRRKDGWSEALESMIGKGLGKASYQDYINGHVRETNRWIREMATREGILLLDFELVLSDQDGIRRKEYSQADGSHISQQGYEALSRYAEERLKGFGGHESLLPDRSGETH